jgi:hypothetical protein
MTMTDPSSDRVPTTFMSQRGLNPTTKLIYVGAAVVFLAAVFWLGKAYMMTSPDGQEGQAPAVATVPAPPPAVPPPVPVRRGSATSAESAAPATAAQPLTTASAASAEAADQPIHAAPELVLPPPAPTPAPAQSAQPASGDLPSFKKQDIDLSRGEALLEDVRDHTFGVDEAAFYWLIEAVNALPASRFAPEPPDKQVAISKLAEFPRTYRGQPVTLSLLVGQVEKFGLPLTHAVGVKGLWVIEAYQTPFVGEAPVCEIILTEDPGNVAPTTPFLVRGYFYKVRSYDKLHEDGDIWVHQSPLIIGKTIEIVPPATEITGSAADIMNGKNSSLVLAAGLLLTFVVLIIIRRTMSIRAGMPTLQSKRELTPEEVAARVNYLQHEETAPPSALTDEEDPDPIELARRRDEALAKFEEQARKPKK